MFRCWQFRRWADAFWLTLIFVYIVTAAYNIAAASSDGNSASNGNINTPVSRVLAASSDIRFQEQYNAPSPNDIFRLVNEQRARQGFQPLRPNILLGSVAEQRADDMVRRNYYAHKNPDGKYYYDFLSGSGAESNYSCENLDLQFSMEPSRYVDDWLNSSAGHRECLLNSNVADAGYAVRIMDNLHGTQAAYIVVAVHGSVD